MQEISIYWSARLAMAAYFAALALLLTRRWHAARSVWSVGCAIFVVHVACAMGMHHHWNHEHALEETAARTDELLGIRFEGGLWINYLFTLVWVADVIWWWMDEKSYWKKRWTRAVILSFMLLIVINGTIVFAQTGTRVVFSVACLGLLILWWQQSQSRAAGNSMA